uniref:Zinc finger protein n=1 Tax=Toxocara canis TaxID=6265 RepID=A0A183UKT9_TOXCA
LENLEVHLWACHLRSFPYRCAKCGYPALNSKALIAHFSECHDAPTVSVSFLKTERQLSAKKTARKWGTGGLRQQQVEFKRRIEHELRLRELISRSVVLPALEEQVYCDDELLTEERRDKYVVENQSTVTRDSQLPRVVHVVGGELIEKGVPMPETSYDVYEEGDEFISLEDDDHSVQYIGEEGNPVDSEELFTDFEELVRIFEAVSRRLLSSQHKRRLESAVRSLKSKPRRRPPTVHQCEDCGKILKYPSKIAEHRRSHTGERPHVCPQCGTSFSQKGALKCHIRLHTGEKPYPCTWECGRSFVSSSARQMHQKVHTGEKPFSCAFCGQLFSKKFHMRRHVSTQHSLTSTKSPTGLDAAGKDVDLLVGPVTSVIEDVRRSKMKKKKPSSRPAHNDSNDFLTSLRGTTRKTEKAMAQLHLCESILDSEMVEGDYESIIIDGELLEDGERIMLPDAQVIDEYDRWETPAPSLCTELGTNRNTTQDFVDRAALEADAKLTAVVDSVASTASFMARSEEEEARRAVTSGVYEEVGGEGPASRRKKATIVRCEYCGVMLKHPSKIQAHMRTHTGEKPFECSICGMRFTQRTPMRMHVRRHVGDTPFVCSWGCGKSFVSNALKNAHEVRIHLGEKRQGPPCPHLKPPRRSVPLTLQGSVSSRAPDPAPLSDGDRSAILNFQPPIGEIKQSSSAAANKKLDEVLFITVIEAVAAGIPLPQPRQARRRAALVAQCQECGLLLKHPSKIQAHLRTHTGERPFQCGVCGMRFATANPLRVHLRRAHTGVMYVTVEGEKPYECTWDCGRRFVSASARNEHERIVHAGIKRYQCTVGSCRRLFTRRRYLIMHQEKEHIEAERQADSAIECVLGMVQREIHSEKKTDSEETPTWIPQGENEERFVEEGDSVKAVAENDEEIAIDANGLDDEVLMYAEELDEHVSDIVIEEGPVEISDEGAQSVVVDRVSEAHDQQLRLANEPFEGSMDLLQDEFPNNVYLYDDDNEYVLIDEAYLEPQEPELELGGECLEEDDEHLVETRSFWLPSSGQTSRLGRVRIIKPKNVVQRRDIS